MHNGASGKNSTVSISYVADTTDMPQPKSPRVLQDSEQTIAYLDYDSKKNVYNLAAFGFSFEEIPHR